MKYAKSLIVIPGLTIVAAGLIMYGCSLKKQKSNKQHPNLLFVFTDQQSYDMLGREGNPQVLTPNLDKLAQDGIYFRYAVSNYPLCTPMRAMLLTGKPPLENGCWENDLPLLIENGTTFGEALDKAGYETAWIGKWHLYGGETRDTGIPPGKNRHGFDGTFLTNNVTVDFSPENCFYWNDANEKVYFKDVFRDHPWELEAQTRQAESWLKNYSGDKPFGLFVSWHPPHDFIGDGCPDIPGRQYNYDVSVLDSSLIDPYKAMDIVLRPDVRDDTIMVNCRKEQYRNYMAMVTACDNSVGRLIKILKEKGEYDNTLIVFTSDHGDMLGSHGANMPKAKPQDYAIRIPLIMSWINGLPINHESHLMIGTLDLMPSLLGLIGINTPDPVQGMDLSKAILNGDDDAVKSVPIFVYAKNAWKGVYTRDWTYAEAMKGNPAEDPGAESDVLFNHVNDPAQMHNLFNNTDYLEIQQNLADLTHQWMAKFDDKGYSADDFYRVMPRDEWKMNYTRRPVDIMNQR